MFLEGKWFSKVLQNIVPNFISVYSRTLLSASLCLAVNSLPLVLKLLCVTQASDPPSSSSYSNMDGVHLKLLYHGEVKSCCWLIILNVTQTHSSYILLTLLCYLYYSQG